MSFCAYIQALQELAATMSMSKEEKYTFGLNLSLSLLDSLRRSINEWKRRQRIHVAITSHAQRCIEQITRHFDTAYNVAMTTDVKNDADVNNMLNSLAHIIQDLDANKNILFPPPILESDELGMQQLTLNDATQREEEERMEDA